LGLKNYSLNFNITNLPIINSFYVFLFENKLPLFLKDLVNFLPSLPLLFSSLFVLP
jgi:hypothetical protein